MALNILQIVFAVILIIIILIQGKGSGLGSVFGGSGNVYRTKRGAEKFLHYATIFLSIAFFAVSFIQFLY